MVSYRPTPPSEVTLNGIATTADMTTKITSGWCRISAKVFDTNNNQNVRIVVRWSSDKNFASYKQVNSGWAREGSRFTVIINGLSQNTLWYVRIYSQDSSGNYSGSTIAGVFKYTYASVRFWTNRFPGPPPLVAPAENSSFPPSVPITFDWHFIDPDDEDNPVQSAFRIEFRRAATATTAAGTWLGVNSPNGTKTTYYTHPANKFAASSVYEWRVRTRDAQNVWGYYSLVRSFTIEGVTKPPLLLGPTSDVAVITDEPVYLRWTFQDPLSTARQGNADVQYRVIGEPIWILVPGSALTVGEMVMPEGTFAPGLHYEWQVKTYRSVGVDGVSDWSNIGRFWSILRPGYLAAPEVVDSEEIQGALGTGRHRAFIFEQGGLINRGEITNMTQIRWTRTRDDVSTASVVVTGYDTAVGELMGATRTWRHELVIFRNDVRVWEGPITHMQFIPGEVTLNAKDVMAYVQRRIMRQGYNDSYHLVSGTQYGMKSIVERAGLILQNSLAYSDPHILPYLTLIRTGADTIQTRVVPDYTKMAWEEIDDLAANAGLDYTVVGRRIIMWDTHNYVGILPEMRDNDFSEPLVVTEYGMDLANFFAVTDGNGSWGSAYAEGLSDSNWMQYYGPIEMLASAYGDSDAVEVMTPAQEAAQKVVLNQQARRNVNRRWPGPLVARVPDNATINPEVNVGVNQLVPGTWIPLRVEATVRPFAQMQKLDSMNVEQTAEGETVQVVMSPAPISEENDPDSQTTSDGSDT